jgi:glycosyltransferase involved in cell wall biosynthesis
MSARTARLDLVIPIYNEAHVLERSVGSLMEALETFELPPWRVVVVDNGSRDGSRAVGEALARRESDRVVYERLEVKGRGIALRTTWSGTDAELSLYMDVDLSTGLEAVPEVVGLLEEGADIVTGSRLHAQARTERSVKREVLSRGYNLLVRRRAVRLQGRPCRERAPAAALGGQRPLVLRHRAPGPLRGGRHDGALGAGSLGGGR